MQDESNTVLLASRFINSTGCPVFLTGKAGTGKTTFLKKVVSTTHKNVVIAAPTGVAAINAGGVTLHSLFQLPFGSFVPDNIFTFPKEQNVPINTPKSLMEGFTMNATKRKLLREMELLIIDEVSMCRADLIDMIDVVLKSVRRNKGVPFGGVQILFIGDLFQLPPIVKDEEYVYLNRYYRSLYFFNALSLTNYQPVHLELNKVYRQSDENFVNLLNKVRSNTLIKSDVDHLNSFYRPGFNPSPEEEFIYLTTHNRVADNINQRELEAIKHKSIEFKARVEGDFNEHQYPLEETLVFKEDAQVMFIKNDYSGESRYYNGRIGRVSKLTPNTIFVLLDNGKEVEVERYTWENKKFHLDKTTGIIEEKVVGTFVQYPLRLAWAITIHKSQGLTFEKAIIDISRAFAPGQAYVALSRLRSLDGLVFNAPFHIDLPKSEKEIVEYSSYQADDEQLEAYYENSARNYIGQSVIKAFGFDHLNYDLQALLDSFNKQEGRSRKQQDKDWFSAFNDRFNVEYKIAQNFVRQLHRLVNGAIDYSYLLERLHKAKDYFSTFFKNEKEELNTHIEALKKETGTKKYIAELNDIYQAYALANQGIIRAVAMVKSTIKGEELTRQALLSIDGFADKRIVSKASKEKKKPTAFITCDMYLEGKKVEEITVERKLTLGTIYSHLAVAVEDGRVPYSAFISEEKCKRILDAFESQSDKKSIGQLKHILGDDCSYPEIKIAIAHKTYSESKESSN